MPITLATLTLACHLPGPGISAISLSYPSGERSLVLVREGDAMLYYGAAPQRLIVAAGTFDIDDVYRRLRAHLRPVEPLERRPPGTVYGTATLRFSDGRASSHMIYDAAIPTALLDTACDAVDRDRSSTAELVDVACARAGADGH